jgi:O-antigen ligase
LLSAKSTVAVDLTSATLWEYAGCLICYFIGALLLSRKNAVNWLLVGILAASAYCLVRALEQRAYEFPADLQVLVEGEHAGWTNMPPEAISEMKLEHIIITTNGMDVANPPILTKLSKGRVYGTLVYPNALAGLILLLFPLGLTVAIQKGRHLRPAIRWLAIGIVGILGIVSFIWTGSKLGWLLAIMSVGIYLLNLGWSTRLKVVSVSLVILLGLGVFGIRFHTYFAKGATSVGARFDYWHAAVKTAVANPATGTGPGTFQRPYESLKSPTAEMARLAHNDYLEQFSDSGIPGGIFYCSWIGLALWAAGRRIWSSKDSVLFAIFVGLLGWFLQGVGEFGLFIPALAWVAFTLLGVLIGQMRINSTEKPQ